MLEVVAGVIEREGRVLICRRRPDQSHALMWEFPGGKVEPGEAPAEALARELEEELGIQASGIQEIDRYTFAYPGKNPLLLIFLTVADYSGDLRNLIFHEIRWEPRATLATFDFLQGDRRFLEHFCRGS